MKYWRALPLLLISLFACVDAPLATRNNLEDPGAATLVCMGPDGALLLTECAEDERNYRLYVLQHFRSALAAIDLNTGSMLDLNPYTPTANGIQLPGQAHGLAPVHVHGLSRVPARARRAARGGAGAA